VAAVSYTTNRGKACKLAAGENGGWVNPDGTPATAYPSHGNWFYVLILDIVGYSDLRLLNTLGDTGVTLQPSGNGYSPVAIARNATNFPVIEDDSNEQAVCTCPNLNLTASGGTIQAKYLAKCDGNPTTAGAANVNIVDLFDLQGLRQSPDGQPFTVTQIATAIVRPNGEA
jgi:hypothetical protein